MTTTRPKGTWDVPGMVERLTALWNDENGLGEPRYSADQIARALGIGKNAVIGKAHRLKLKPRPPAIKRTYGPKPKEPKRMKEAADIRPFAKPAKTQAEGCHWPYGDPQEKDFHFCGLPRVDHKPYCKRHMKEAYYQPGKVDVRGVA